MPSKSILNPCEDRVDLPFISFFAARFPQFGTAEG
jgi:hypothetical protein